MKKNVGIIGYPSTGLAGTMARRIIEATIAADVDVIMIHNRDVKVTVVNHPLTDKQKQVIKAMQNGAFIETTNHCSRCDGIHITKQSFKQLRYYGLIERKEFVGSFSVRHQLTNDGKNYLV